VSTVDKVWKRFDFNGLRLFVYLVLRFAEDAPHPIPPTEGEGKCLSIMRSVWLRQIFQHVCGNPLVHLFHAILPLFAFV
jgi:hypothetical protein